MKPLLEGLYFGLPDWVWAEGSMPPPAEMQVGQVRDVLKKGRKRVDVTCPKTKTAFAISFALKDAGDNGYRGSGNAYLVEAGQETAVIDTLDARAKLFIVGFVMQHVEANPHSLWKAGKMMLHNTLERYKSTVDYPVVSKVDGKRIFDRESAMILPVVTTNHGAESEVEGLAALAQRAFGRNINEKEEYRGTAGTSTEAALSTFYQQATDPDCTDFRELVRRLKPHKKLGYGQSDEWYVLLKACGRLADDALARMVAEYEAKATKSVDAPMTERGEMVFKICCTLERRNVQLMEFLPRDLVQKLHRLRQRSSSVTEDESFEENEGSEEEESSEEDEGSEEEESSDEEAPRKQPSRGQAKAPRKQPSRKRNPERTDESWKIKGAVILPGVRRSTITAPTSREAAAIKMLDGVEDKVTLLCCINSYAYDHGQTLAALLNRVREARGYTSIAPFEAKELNCQREAHGDTSIVPFEAKELNAEAGGLWELCTDLRAFANEMMSTDKDTWGRWIGNLRVLQKKYLRRATSKYLIPGMADENGMTFLNNRGCVNVRHFLEPHYVEEYSGKTCWLAVPGTADWQLMMDVGCCPSADVYLSLTVENTKEAATAAAAAGAKRAASKLSSAQPSDARRAELLAAWKLR